MKKTIWLALFLAMFSGISSVRAQEIEKWKELTAFHEVMSTTFHPMEEGKFEPIRNRSGEMLEKALAWKNSTAPKGYDQQAVQKNLSKLVKGAKKVNNLVQHSGTDAELKEKLTELHEIFHEITEKCRDEK